MQPSRHYTHNHLRLGKGQPTFATQRPEDPLLLDMGAMPNCRQIRLSPGWPKIPWWLPKDGGEHMCAVIDLLSRLVGRKQPEGPMRIGMITDFMTGFGDGANDRRVLLRPLADDEKRGSNPKLRQDVEDTWCEDGVGTVVKGQGHGMITHRTTSFFLRDVSSQQIGPDGIERSTGTCHA